MKEMSEFFYFAPKYLPSTFKAFIDTEDKNILENPGLLEGSYQGISFPIIFKYEGGSKLCDLIETGIGSVNLISDKMISLFRENRLTGWKTFEAKVLDKEGNEIRGYQGLSVTGKCGPITYDQSKLINIQRIPNGPITKYYKGLYVGVDKWDGSDFFLPEKSFGIIVTTRVKKIVKENKLTNIELTNLMDIETPEYSLKIRGII